MKPLLTQRVFNKPGVGFVKLMKFLVKQKLDLELTLSATITTEDSSVASLTSLAKLLTPNKFLTKVIKNSNTRTLSAEMKADIQLQSLIKFIYNCCPGSALEDVVDK